MQVQPCTWSCTFGALLDGAEEHVIHLTAVACRSVLQLLLHQKMPLPSTIAMVGLEKPLLDSNSLLDGTAVQVGS
jgi:hypothetical protein